MNTFSSATANGAITYPLQLVDGQKGGSRFFGPVLDLSNHNGIISLCRMGEYAGVPYDKDLDINSNFCQLLGISRFFIQGLRK